MGKSNVSRATSEVGHLSYLAEVARGNIYGAKPVASFGERVTAGAETERVIWPNGIFTLPPAAGVQMTLVSTSAEDADGLTGVRELEIHYLDANLIEKSELVTLNGLTPVVTVATDIRFIQCMHVNHVGSALSAVGTITAANTGTTYSQLNPGSRRCSSSARMVPAGKKLFIAGASAGSSSTTSDSQGIIRIVVSELDTHQYTDPLILLPIGSIALQDSSTTFNFPVPIPVRSGSVVAMTGTVDKAATLTASWFGWEEELE